jgi:ornithine carbamoyltransferase
MLEQKGRLAGLKVAFVGDGNNVAHSLMFAGAQLGAHVWVGTPPGYEPLKNALAWAEHRAAETGGSCTITTDPVEAVRGADVVYTDVWASMGAEVEADERRQHFLTYQVNAALFSLAKPDAIFMHCLPAHRGDEVTDEVIDCSRSVVFQQAENRLHVQKAIMLQLMKETVGEIVATKTEELVHV